MLRRWRWFGCKPHVPPLDKTGDSNKPEHTRGDGVDVGGGTKVSRRLGPRAGPEVPAQMATPRQPWDGATLRLGKQAANPPSGASRVTRAAIGCVMRAGRGLRPQRQTARERARARLTAGSRAASSRQQAAGSRPQPAGRRQQQARADGLFALASRSRGQALRPSACVLPARPPSIEPWLELIALTSAIAADDRP